MSRLIIGSLLLLTMLFSPLAQARNDYSPRSEIKASFPNHLLIGDVKQRLLPTPPTLEHYGAYFYDLQEESGAHATIFLYSGIGLPKAAVEINRDVARGDTLYTIMAACILVRVTTRIITYAKTTAVSCEYPKLANTGGRCAQEKVLTI